MSDVCFQDIVPFVRFSKTLILPEDFATAAVHAYDARLIYFYSGSAKVKLDDHTYTASRGSIFLWQSAVKYSITNVAGADTRIMAINFDYFHTADPHIHSIPTVSDRLYRKEDAIEHLTFTDVPALNAPIHLEGMQQLERTFSDMTEEFLAPKPFMREILSLDLRRVLIQVLRKLQGGNDEKLTGLVEQVVEYIRKNYASDLTNEAIGKQFCYHPNYINRVIRKHTGQSLHQYVLSVRIAKALEMLQTTDLSVTEIAERVGFSSIKHFSQAFKSIYGYSPIHFRK